MSNILLLILCLIIGILLRRFKTLPDNAPVIINRLIITVFIPAITFRYGLELNIQTDFLLPLLATWIVFGVSFLFFIVIQKRTEFDRPTIGALIVVAGISSISFVGFPVFELLYGAEGLKAGVVMSQMGTFVICSTAGLFVVSAYGNDSSKLNWLKLIKDIFMFPPFIAFCTAFILKNLHYNPSSVVLSILEKLGSPMNITALVSIGLQMDFSGFAQQRQALFLGLLFKLIIAPLLIF